ncbi:2-octaprenyl-3-methyl-6-methoxy-1,4-benzoquinol hydroxylase [Labrenzia sp. THAF191b]|uniref:UbiH/UbiF family hydroxylase n=1 Tax=unclassified Labrenzia TaxID=2648686 RepID=UPI001268C117|nr:MULTISPECIES: UbiH/UbiF family hydroxylase [unclassified Labrenzia]QFS99871.1 2-octaprenyl-3-methyl-6-methoxy-1,4-benzoquinol hydroxylase [Labrenzia sp. THAF191b]QFT06185.1 2-octaprenyl-3-methyl-6-methoxy-1,4-benzoquinol hydroxylase [Labrenzia sp. THAF191a]QFT17729.1 2-octaprenyl-3-methyl-6-methoxy-1,4-benzoquinol hydroxylase [Labrenzia sp. THAF187b]
MSSSHAPEQFDIAIVGGGPSGRIAALALAQQGLSCVLIAPSMEIKDGRTTALWQRSIDLLRDIGVWSDIEGNAASLKKMRMIDSTGRLFRAPEVVFDSSELGLEEFGFNILNSELNVVLEKFCAAQAGLEEISETVESAEFGDEHATLVTRGGRTISAKLAVAADGRRSTLREAAGIEVKSWSYPQVAVVLNLEHRLPHQQVSTEFHTATGPFTLVPLPGRQSSLVCVETADGAADLLAMTEEDLEAELERRAHSILGRFKLSTKPQSFPLSGLTATSLVGPRLALVGETAHVFPPIGAQGLNLSLRDIRDLISVVASAVRARADFGGKTVLSAYEKKRFSDIRTRTNAVDMLNRSLLTGFLPVQAARSAGMYLAGKIGPLRRLLMREGIAPGTAFQLHR